MSRYTWKDYFTFSKKERVAVIILLFLPLKFNANNINDRALAQTPHCDASGPDYDVEWCLYEMIGLK
jgi:hypothetical protein